MAKPIGMTLAFYPCRMKSLTIFSSLMAAVVVFLACPGLADAQRIRDLARIKGVRPQHLTGIGLVIGLNSTGDSQQNKLLKKFYFQLIQNMGTRIPIEIEDLKSRNTAVVVVSATVPSSLKVGSEFEVVVSSIGDADSILGGYLLAVPMRGPNAMDRDQKVPYYAVAQGRIFSEREGESKMRVGKSPAVLEAPIDDLPFLSNLEDITILLNEPDYGTVSRVAAKINEQDLFKDPAAPSTAPSLAAAIDSGMVRVQIPTAYLQGDRVIDFISQVLDLEMPEIEREALVAVNRQTGSVVINGSVRVASSALISYKGMMVRVPAAGGTDDKNKAPSGPLERNPLLIDVIKALEKEEFKSTDIAHILRQLHRTGALIGKFVEE